MRTTRTAMTVPRPMRMSRNPSSRAKRLTASPMRSILERSAAGRMAAPGAGAGGGGSAAAGAGAGESASGVGADVPTRPPHHIPDGWAWRPVGPLAGRQGNVAVWTGSEVIYWGGDRPGRAPEGAGYDPEADRWRRLSRSPLTNRRGAAAAWTGREVVVFGGVNGG